MTTINLRNFADLIGTHPAVELIDVRPREDFEREHIRGARSIPLSHLTPRRSCRTRTPGRLFLICNGRVRASLAAGMLREAGCLDPVVIEGGMKSWKAQGLPTLQPYGDCAAGFNESAAPFSQAVVWCAPKLPTPEPLRQEGELWYRPFVR